jgi:putative sterol carrier protein
MSSKRSRIGTCPTRSGPGSTCGGDCREAKYGITPEEGEKAMFIIRAPYSRWKEVIRKELDPVKGMMQGKLKLKGDLPTIVRYVKAANELVNLASRVPTQFVDEK